MSTVSIDNAEHYIWGDQCDGWHLARSPKRESAEGGEARP